MPVQDAPDETMLANHHLAMANRHFARGEMRLAEGACLQAIAAKPDSAEAYNNLGVIRRRNGREQEAMALFSQALSLNDRLASAAYNLGNVLLAFERFDDAVHAFDQALALEQSSASTWNNRAVALQHAGRLDEAVASYQQALVLEPHRSGALAEKLHLQAHMCDWSCHEEFGARADWLGIEGEAVAPFSTLAFEDNPKRQLRRSRNSIRRYAGSTAREIALPPRPMPERLRIGYLSADFHQHATMILLAGVLAHHDIARFEVTAYSYGPLDSEGRRAMPANVRLVDVRSLNDIQVAQRIRADGIDIVVDLNGHTWRSRLGILAHRAAPVQISYLAYPGSTGTDFIDYLIADRVTIPASTRSGYSESIIYLPRCYQPAGIRDAITLPTSSRRENGLPESGPVLCCFNNSFKIGPAEFDIWMRLLCATEGSVLWLLRTNRWAEENLSRAARARGVDPARLIFAAPRPYAEHLARARLADLFLDTFNYNAHTTAGDALWAGVPVVTLAGRQFAARVAASLLTELDIPELITHDQEDYEARCRELLGDRNALAQLRRKLAEKLKVSTLFDAATSARALEDAYKTVHRRCLSGQAPTDIG